MSDEIRTQCPGCGKALRAPASRAGQWAKCPYCGIRVLATVPRAEENVAADEPQNDAAPGWVARLRTRINAPQKPISRRGLLLAGLAMLLLIALRIRERASEPQDYSPGATGSNPDYVTAPEPVSPVEERNSGNRSTAASRVADVRPAPAPRTQANLPNATIAIPGRTFNSSTASKPASASQDPKEAVLTALKAKNYAEAKRLLTGLRQTNASDPWVVNGLAWLLATCPDATIRSPTEAAILIGKLPTLGSWYGYYDTWAVALAGFGNFDGAKSTEYQAILMAARSSRVGDEERRSFLQDAAYLLEHFDCRKPYIENGSIAESWAKLPKAGIVSGADRLLAVHIPEALRYTQKGRYSKAIDTISVGLILYPGAKGTERAYGIRGASFCRLGMYSQAQSDLTRAIDLWPNSGTQVSRNNGSAQEFSDVLAWRALANQKLGESTAANADIKRAASMDSKYRDGAQKVTSRADRFIEEHWGVIVSLAAGLVFAVAVISEEDDRPTSGTGGRRLEREWVTQHQRCPVCGGKGYTGGVLFEERRCDNCAGKGESYESFYKLK